jgi:hypothetical protein
MAWWDHEELKSPADRSDRYKLTFPDEYSAEEIFRAALRQKDFAEIQRYLDKNANPENIEQRHCRLQIPRRHMVGVKA